MRKITVSVDDDTYKRARIAAAALDTSVSALVKTYLEQLPSVERENDALRRREREIRSMISNSTASSRLSRAETHGRPL